MPKVAGSKDELGFKQHSSSETSCLFPHTEGVHLPFVGTVPIPVVLTCNLIHPYRRLCCIQSSRTHVKYDQIYLRFLFIWLSNLQKYIVRMEKLTTNVVRDKTMCTF
jgi:hypothetical protein